MIYPIPAKDKLIVDFKNNAFLDKAYSLVNAQGQIFQGGSISDLTLNLDVSNLDSGLYFLRVENTEGELSYRKVLVD